MARKEMCESLSDSKKKYTEYIENHISNVARVFTLFGEELYDYVTSRRTAQKKSKHIASFNTVRENIASHDSSKFSDAEFEPYRARFYPYYEDQMNSNVEEEFEKAWEHHYTHNKHHPEYWLIKMSGKEKVIPMSNEAFIEMICDWVAMSMNFKESTYEWWKNNREKKAKYFTPLDLEFIDKVMKEFEVDFDFSEIKKEEA